MSLLWGRKNNPKGKIVLIPGDVDWLAKAKGCLSFAFVHKHIHIHKDTCCRPTVWIRLHCWGQRQKASQQKTPTGRQASEGRGMATWVQRERERYVTKIGHIFGIFNIRENCELNLKWLKANFCHAKLHSFAQCDLALKVRSKLFCELRSRLAVSWVPPTFFSVQHSMPLQANSSTFLAMRKLQ